MGRYLPAHIDPNIIKRAKLKHRRELKTDVKELYRLDPILWAVVKGHNTDALLATKFPDWGTKGTQRGVERALKHGLIRRWGGRYVPRAPHHKELAKKWEKYYPASE